MIFTCKIPSRPIVKKNTSRRVGYGKSTRVIYSPKYLQWEYYAVIEMREAYKGEPLSVPLRLVLRFYFKDRQAEADTSNLVEGVADCLKKAGVIKDDKLIVKLEAEKFFYENPRTEVEIYKYQEVVNAK